MPGLRWIVSLCGFSDSSVTPNLVFSLNLTWSALLRTAELFILFLFHKCKDLAFSIIHWNRRRTSFAWAEQDELLGKVLPQLIRIHMSHHQQTGMGDAGGTTKCKFYSHLLNIHLWWITLELLAFPYFQLDEDLTSKPSQLPSLNDVPPKRSNKISPFWRLLQPLSMTPTQEISANAQQ